MVPGIVVYIANAGYYEVQSIIGTLVYAYNLGYPGNASVGTTIPAGQLVTAGGLQGAAGTAGANAYGYTNQTALVPSVGSAVGIAFGSQNLWAVPGVNIYIANAGYYQIASVIGNVIYATNLGYPGNAAVGASMTPGQLFTASGPPGQNAYGYTNQVWVMPGVGSPQGIADQGAIPNENLWMTPGLVVYVAGVGYMQIWLILNTVVYAKNLGYPGNAPVNTSVPIGTLITPAGLIGPNEPTSFVSGNASPATFSNVSDFEVFDSITVTIPDATAKVLIDIQTGVSNVGGSTVVVVFGAGHLGNLIGPTLSQSIPGQTSGGYYQTLTYTYETAPNQLGVGPVTIQNLLQLAAPGPANITVLNRSIRTRITEF
jgi:hypothetical protein